MGSLRLELLGLFRHAYLSDVGTRMHSLEGKTIKRCERQPEIRFVGYV